MTESAAQWEQLVTERQVELPSPMLASGLGFLEHHRTNQGWGAFPGTTFDRHASAVAMEALLADWRRAETGSQLSVTVHFFASKYRDQYRGLGADALADVAHLLAPSLDSQDPEWRALMTRAEIVTATLIRDRAPDAARRVAAIILAFATAGKDEMESRHAICDFLISQQQSSGCWSTIPGDGGSITATSEALRALALFNSDEARKASDVALRFVRERAEASLADRTSVDTFELAVMLRALGTYPAAPYRLVSAVETELVGRQDAQDGGWPSAQGRASSIELTGLAILAMAEAGARSHVPARLARAAVADLGRIQSADSTVTEEADAVRRLEIDLSRTRKTASLVPELEREARMLRRLSEPLTYERDLLTERFVERTARWTLGVAAVAVAATVVVSFATRGSPNGASLTEIVALLAALVVTTLAIAMYTQRRNARRSARVLHSSRERLLAQELGTMPKKSEDGNLSELRRGLQFIVEDWPASTREELRYVLYESFLSVPSDVAARRAEQVAIALGIPAKDTAQFSAWASAVGSLPEDERRVLFDQIRRVLS
jgi:hypothetical protein